MEKEFVPYELSLELKQLGMDLGWYNYLNFYDSSTKEFCFVMKDVPAPLYQQAFRWFREKYGLCGHIKPENNEDDIIAWEYVILTIVDDFAGVANASEVCFTTRKSNYTTYEEAELACLQKLIEIVKTK